MMNMRFHRDGKHAAARGSVFAGRPGRSGAVAGTASVSRTRALSRALRLVVLFVLTAAMVLAGSVVAPKNARAAGKPTLPETGNSIAAPNGQVHWLKLNGLTAEWSASALENGHYLHASSSYWATTKGSWELAKRVIVNANDTNYSEPVLGEIYDYHDSTAVPTYKTRLALSLHYSGSASNPVFPHDDVARTDFFTSAVGVRPSSIKTDNAKSSLSVYFTSYKEIAHPGTVLNTAVTKQLACTDTTTVCGAANSPGSLLKANGDSEYSNIMFRVDDGSPTVWVAMWPNHFMSHGTARARSGELSGMEVDPRTGYIYVKGSVNWTGSSPEKSRVDCIAANSDSVNTTCQGVQFLVWDPATGRYAESHEIQPKTLNERKKYYLNNQAWFSKTAQQLANLSNVSDSENANGNKDGALDPSHVRSAYFAQQGFALDKQGNVLLLVSNSSRSQNKDLYGDSDLDTGDTGIDNPRYTQSLLVISPFTDSSSNYLNTTYGSFSDAWQYTVLAKYKHSTTEKDGSASVTWQNGYGNLIVSGPVNKELASFGYRGLGYASPSASFPAATNYTNPYYPGALMMSDSTSQSGIKRYSILARDADGKIKSDLQITIDNNFMTTSLSSPEVVSSISGTVRWNKSGNGTLGIGSDGQPVESKDNPRLEGQTVALYDKTGALVETTTTDQYGEYSFYSAEAANNPDYSIRLVQPQVDLGTAGAVREEQMPDADSSTGYRTVYVSTVLKTSGDSSSGRVSKTDSGVVLHNAVQTWAQSDGSVERLLEDGTSISAKNNSPNTAYNLSISSTANCLAGVNTTVSGSINRYEQCYGTKRAPYIDPAVSTIGSTMKTSDMPIYSSVSVTGGDELTSMDAIADFAVTAAGSYGDSPHTSSKPFRTSAAEKGIYMTGVDSKGLHLGTNKGTYEDAPDSDSATGENHDSDDATKDNDDGVSLVHGEFGVKKTVVPDENSLRITVSGYANDKFYVFGWLSDAGTIGSDSSKATWSTSATKSNTVFKSIEETMPESGSMTLRTSDRVNFARKWGYKPYSGATGLTTAGNFTQLLAFNKRYILRVAVVPASLVTDNNLSATAINVLNPDDSTGQFDGAAYGDTSDTKMWTYPGEVEDYVINTSSSTPVVRIQTRLDGTTLPSDPTFTYQNGTRKKSQTLTKTNEFQPTLLDFASEAFDSTGNIKSTYATKQTTWGAGAGTNPSDAWYKPVFNMPWGYADTPAAAEAEPSTSVVSLASWPAEAWYDSSYKVTDSDADILSANLGVGTENPTTGSGAWDEGLWGTKPSYASGIACYRNYSDDAYSVDSGDAYITNTTIGQRMYGDRIGHLIPVSTQGADDTSEQIASAAKNGVVIGTDSDGHPKMTFSKEQVPKGSVVTCLVPYSQHRFELPLTGKAFPWTLVAGLALLVIGLAGTALALAHRRH